MPDLIDNSDLDFTESGGSLTGKALRLNDGTNTATASEVRTLLDRSLIDNGGSTPAVMAGAADSEDANGNPTPNTTSFPAANYTLGTIFYSSSLAATLNSGADTVQGGRMIFRREGGAGSETWKWIAGSFRATNSNGEYHRDADGTQTCRFLRGTNAVASTTAGNVFVSSTITLTFPAAFSAQPEVSPAVEWSGTNSAAWATNRLITTTTTEMLLFSHVSTGEAYPGYIAEGTW